MKTTPRLVALALVALIASGCATPRPGTQAHGEQPSRELPFDLCVGDELVEADPSFYRDEPVYGPHEQPLDLLDDATSWARQQGGFEEAWFDHDHLGWIHLGFTGDVDVDALQTAVEQEFPGEGVVVVHLPFATAELVALVDRARDAVVAVGGTIGGSSASAPSGKVTLDAVAPDPATIEALAAFADEPLCVDLLPEHAFVAEGAQATSGEGWRLLGEERGAGDVYRTGIATDDVGLAALWTESGLPGGPGEVDWEREVVVWFGTAQSSSCPERLDGVSVTGTTLHADLVVPGWPGACTDDANPHSFVVAVERAILPSGPFHLQLDAEEPPPGAPEERTVVDVDLTVPGSTL